MTELELRLHELREEIAWPQTPAIEPDPRVAPARRRWRGQQLAIALAVLLVVLAGVLALSPGARSAFLEVFHIRGATVERVERLPEVPTTGIPLGQRVSREEAERRVGFPLVDVGDRRRVCPRHDCLARVPPANHPRLVLTQGPGIPGTGS
jgi:hypothetical protein